MALQGMHLEGRAPRVRVVASAADGSCLTVLVER